MLLQTSTSDSYCINTCPPCFLSLIASPIHNHGDPLPGAEGSHILQLFICDPHRNQQFLRVTGAQSEMRPDGITKLDLRQGITSLRIALWEVGPGTLLPHRARSCAHCALSVCGGGLGLDGCFGSPAPALSLVVAVDMRDSPDILQVKAHPRQLSLLPTSYVLSCNTVPTRVSIQEHHVRGWRRDANQEIKSLPNKTAWPHLADTGEYAGPPRSVPGTRRGRQRQRGPQAWQVLLWPGSAVRATLGTA